MPSVFGLDLGSSQIKVCQAEKSGTGYKLRHLAVESIFNQTEAEAIKNVVKAAGIKSASEVNLALPESEVYTRIVDVPKLTPTELNSAIAYEAEQYIPVSLEEVELFHQILPVSDEIEAKTMPVLLIAVPKDRLNKATALLDSAGLIPHSLETELFALKRVLADPGRYQLLLLLSHKTTDMMVLVKGEPVFLHSIPGGGLALTRSLVSEMGLSEMQAEQYKHTYGLMPDMLEGKVAAVLKPLVLEWVNQIEKAYIYLTGRGYKKSPEQLVLAGGGALLPGLSSFLVTKLNTEVVIADPFKNFVKDDAFKKLVTAEANPQWAVAVGLAVKSQKP